MQLKGLRLEFPEDDKSPLGHKLREIYAKPLYAFSVIDLRIMVSQGLALDIVIPMSVERLEENPFLRADLYYGDLLTSLLNVPIEYWKSNQAAYWAVTELVSGLPIVLKSLDAKIESFLNNDSMTKG
jgi:hypothetical protein